MSTHAHLDADLHELLTGWSAPSPEQERLRLDYLAHLAAHEDASAKAGPPAHFTASCLVVDEPRERVLLTLHRKVGRWLQFGGHIEASDPGIAAAARREAVEESGLPAGSLRLLPELAQLDRHALGSGFTRCTEHLNLRWVAVAAAGAEPVVSPESIDVAWWPVAALPPDTDASIRALVSALP
ncbi:NUDIX domain-containing protein [Janibacter indicus]|uniref:8-oxo-dGTP pyrophosphatase MutT, NUDIX family n=1 Tax=Janibacter indicus TaxID=857417 RepID=A0A1W1ZEQ0_9MICO|nr:NUDIX domain-containing protein [Janibacter indicus]SMC46631.1 8-oxo-dGTP pyrophosphatase MutT, NUDIX family [Janibacter indicus]